MRRQTGVWRKLSAAVAAAVADALFAAAFAAAIAAAASAAALGGISVSEVVPAASAAW